MKSLHKHWTPLPWLTNLQVIIVQTLCEHFRKAICTWPYIPQWLSSLIIGIVLMSRRRIDLLCGGTILFTQNDLSLASNDSIIFHMEMLVILRNRIYIANISYFWLDSAQLGWVFYSQYLVNQICMLFKLNYLRMAVKLN